MTKHKHSELIKAKADNIDLYTLVRALDGKWYKKIDRIDVGFSPECEYWLCLPEYEEACLAWLHGKEVQDRDSKGDCRLFSTYVETLCDSSKLLKYWITEGNNPQIKPKLELKEGHWYKFKYKSRQRPVVFKSNRHVVFKVVKNTLYGEGLWLTDNAGNRREIEDFEVICEMVEKD